MLKIFFYSELQTGRSTLPFVALARDTKAWIMRASTRTHIMRRRLETNNGVVVSTLRGLAGNYALGDIFTMDVTTLAYRRSPVANKDSTEGFRVYLTMSADATEKLNPTVVGASKRDNLAHIRPG